MFSYDKNDHFKIFVDIKIWRSKITDMKLTEKQEKVTYTQDNEIIRSQYTLLVPEKRLLMLAMSKINPLDFSVDPKPYTITLKEWKQYFPAGTALRDFKKTALTLLSRNVIFHKKSNQEERLSAINWLEKVDIIDNNRIELQFTRQIWSRLSNLNDNFSSTNLLKVSKMTKFSSIRLYELLMQWRTTGNAIISVEDFRFMMNCENKYPATKTLKAKVLKTALKEIEEVANIKVIQTDIKKGKSITHFKFIYDVNGKILSHQSELFPC